MVGDYWVDIYHNHNKNEYIYIQEVMIEMKKYEG